MHPLTSQYVLQYHIDTVERHFTSSNQNQLVSISWIRTNIIVSTFREPFTSKSITLLQLNPRFFQSTHSSPHYLKFASRSLFAIGNSSEGRFSPLFRSLDTRIPLDVVGVVALVHRERDGRQRAALVVRRLGVLGRRRGLGAARPVALRHRGQHLLVRVVGERELTRGVRFDALKRWIVWVK